MSIWDNLIDGQKEDLKKFAKEFEAFRKTIDKASDEITKSVQTITKNTLKQYIISFYETGTNGKRLRLDVIAESVDDAVLEGWARLRVIKEVFGSSLALWRLEVVNVVEVKYE